MNNDVLKFFFWILLKNTDNFNKKKIFKFIKNSIWKPKLTRRSPAHRILQLSSALETSFWFVVWSEREEKGQRWNELWSEILMMYLMILHPQKIGKNIQFVFYLLQMFEIICGKHGCMSLFRLLPRAPALEKL